MSVVVKDESGKFVELNGEALDRVMNMAAKDVFTLSRLRVPLGVNKSNKKSGNRNITSRGAGLQGSSYWIKTANGHWVVVYNKEYAGYQERGQRKDGTHIIKNHSVPGRQAHFLESSGADVQKTLETRIIMAVKGIKMKVIKW
jgi:hypothetical protein